MAKESKIPALISKLEKQFGKGSLQKMSEKPRHKYDVIPTGSIGLDLALGIGGVPKGRIVELYGQESSGKSTLTLHMTAEAQKDGTNVALIDSEYAFDPVYAENLGVDLDKLFLSQPDNAEQALEITDEIASSGEFGLIIVDSVAALVPKAELEGEMGDSRMGVMARLMSQALRKLTGTVSKNNVALVFINQMREKIGVMFGNPWTTTGGNSLKFYASIRMEVNRSTQVKDGNEAVGNLTKVKIVKNKTAPPFKVAEFNIEYGQGIDQIRELIDLAVEAEIIKRSGSWYSYGDARLGQGADNVKALLLDNPELLEEVKEKVLELFVPEEEQE